MNHRARTTHLGEINNKTDVQTDSLTEPQVSSLTQVIFSHNCEIELKEGKMKFMTATKETVVNFYSLVHF